jgi:hypothetical protein
MEEIVSIKMDIYGEASAEVSTGYRKTKFTQI